MTNGFCLDDESVFSFWKKVVHSFLQKIYLLLTKHSILNTKVVVSHDTKFYSDACPVKIFATDHHLVCTMVISKSVVQLL